MWSFRICQFYSATIILYVRGWYNFQSLFLCFSKLLIFIHTKQYIMAKEIIKEIDGLPDYYISNEGIAYSTKVSPRYNPKGELRILRPRTHPSGYLYIGCFIGKGKTKKRLWRRVHRVVAQTFIGKIGKGMEINHLDGDKHNNNLANLEIVTRHQNLIHYHRILKPQRNA